MLNRFLKYVVILFIVLSFSCGPVFSNTNQFLWKVGDVYTWETLSTTFEKRISPNNIIENDSYYSKIVNKFKIEDINTSNKMITLTSNNHGRLVSSEYNYSSRISVANFAHMIIVYPQLSSGNKTVITSISAYFNPPYISEFNPLDFKDFFEIYWGNNNTDLVWYYNGTQQVLFTVGEFLSLVDGFTFMGKPTIQDGLNQINTNTRVFSLEVDCSSAFKLPTPDYQEFNISVDKKIYRYEFGITSNGILDYLKVINYYSRTDSSDDGYMVTYNYTRYQKLNSVGFVINVYPVQSNLTVIFLIGIVLGIVLFPLSQKSYKYYKQWRLNSKK